MKLTAAELAYVRSQGLYTTEKCGGFGVAARPGRKWSAARSNAGPACITEGLA